MSLNLFAQKNDSVKVQSKSPVAEYFLEKDFFPNNSSYKKIDTSLDNTQKHFPNNFPYSLGLAKRKLFFEPSIEIGFRSGFENLDLFGYNRNETKYYSTRAPYTDAMVVFGMKKEQFVRLLHTQNISKQWNVALNLLRLRSEGFYQRQNCTDNNLSLSSNYISKSNHYSFLVNGMVSSIKTDENGGLKNDSLYENNLLVNKMLFPVNIINARTRIMSREFTVVQFWNFGKRDTANRDSTIHRKIIPRNYISYSFHAQDSRHVYDDKNPNSTFYSKSYFDSARTLDSTRILKMENEIALSHLFAQRKNIFNESSECFRVSLKNQIVHIKLFEGDSSKYHLLDSVFTNLFASAFFHKSFFTFKGDHCFSGPNKNDFYSMAKFSFPLSPVSLLEIKADVSQTNPAFIYNTYSSNNFFWENNFDKLLSEKISAKFLTTKYKLSIEGNYQQLSNYVYLNSSAKPQRAASAFTIYSAEIRKTFSFGKIKFYNRIIFQHTTDSVLHLPEFFSNHSLYYENNLFHSAMYVQIGFDVTYYSSYYADAYMPALGLFYRQNQKLVGNYPFADFFLNMKVKHVRFFFKTEHLNSGLVPVYLVPNYPAPDRAVKVGVSWVFYD